MADHVTDRFNGLDFEGFHAGSFVLQAREKLILRLSDFHRIFYTTQDSDSRDYELQFNRPLDGRIEVEGPGGLGAITAWRAHDDSAFLVETLRGRDHLLYGEAYAHFELTSDQGKLEVVARDYYLTVVDYSNLSRPRGGGGAE